MLSCSIWFSAPRFWKGGGLESRCVGRVYGEDASHGTILASPGLVTTQQISFDDFIEHKIRSRKARLNALSL
jgi:hypothetical protein